MTRAENEGGMPRSIALPVLQEPEKEKKKKAMAQFKEQQFYLLKDPFTPDLIETARNEAPHTWWLVEHGAHIPELQNVAVIVLSQVTSSSTSERNWKEFDFIHNKRRNRVGFERAKQLVKVRSSSAGGPRRGTTIGRCNFSSYPPPVHVFSFPPFQTAGAQPHYSLGKGAEGRHRVPSLARQRRRRGQDE